jgi:hypothetical protein
VLATPAIASGRECPTVIDETFASAATLRALNATVAGFGLRSTGSPAHRRLIDWLERRMTRLPGVSVRSESFSIQRWQPGPGLLLSGGVVPVASPVPYAAPGLRSGTLISLRPGTPITAANARGKVVLRVTLKDYGTVAVDSVEAGLPHGLTEKAVEAAERIKFEPARLGRAAVPQRATVEYTFGP